MSANTRIVSRGKLADDWDEIKRLIEDGVPKTRIAKKFNCSRETIRLRLLEEKGAVTPTGDDPTTNNLSGVKEEDAFSAHSTLSALSGNDSEERSA